MWAKGVGAWADVLVGEDVASFVALGLDDPAVDAYFTIARQTAYSPPAAAQSVAA